MTGAVRPIMALGPTARAVITSGGAASPDGGSRVNTKLRENLKPRLASCVMST